MSLGHFLHQPVYILGLGHLLATQGHDHVARSQPGPIGRLTGAHLANISTAARDTRMLPHLRRSIGDGSAQLWFGFTRLLEQLP